VVKEAMKTINEIIFHGDYQELIDEYSQYILFHVYGSFIELFEEIIIEAT